MSVRHVMRAEVDLIVTEKSSIQKLIGGPHAPDGVREDAARLKAKRHFPDAANTIAIVGDTAMILLGLLLGFWIRFESGWIPWEISWWTSKPIRFAPPVTQYFRLFGLGAALLLLTFMATSVYERQNLLRFRRSMGQIGRALIFWLFAYLGISLALEFTPNISRIYAIISVLSCGMTLAIWRWIFHQFVQQESIARNLRQQVVFVGWGTDASKFYDAICSDRHQPYRLLGCVPLTGNQFTEQPPVVVPRLTSADDLPSLLATGYVDVVILAQPDPATAAVLTLANLCEREHVQFMVIPSYFQILISGLHLESISGVPILGVAQLPLDRLPNRILKRSVDLVGGLVGLLLSLPVIIVFGALVYLESPGPIFYRQVRVGRSGRRFEIIKIRSMRLNAEEATGAKWAVKNDPRRLRIGTLLREWNFDEVPQFWNVLIGDMSLVGPRPERPELIARFKHEIPHYNARHGAKPGITGWAQVHGLRGNTDLAERVRYDLWYLENWSLWLDFQIMVMTFLQRKNAY